MSDAIDLFKGDNFYLSNFYPAPIQWQGKEWASTEHAFQAAKTIDPAQQEKIRLASTAGKAKRLGDNPSETTMRPDWEQVKYQVMLDVVTAKFEQHRDLREKLLATGNVDLVEGNNWHDNTWGRCTCSGCAGKEGKNWLGIILMRIRFALRQSSAPQEK